MSQAQRILITIAGISFVGCGIGTGTPVHVAGTVFVDGRPLKGAGVFVIRDAPADDRPAAHGTTDEAGHYELYPQVTPGTYRVIVRAMVGSGFDQVVPGFGSDGVDEGQLAAAISASAGSRNSRSTVSKLVAGLQSLPEIYSSPEDTVLRIDVPGGGTSTADLHLALEMLADETIAQPEPDTAVH